jgi:hypothetical protein
MVYQQLEHLGILFFGRSQNKKGGVMKLVIILGFLILSIYSHTSVTKYNQARLSQQQVDTLSVIHLNSKLYKKSNYKLLHLSFSENEREEIHFFLRRVTKKSSSQAMSVPRAHVL